MSESQHFHLNLTAHPFPEDRDAAIRKDFKNYTHGLMQSQPGNLIMTPRHFKYAEDIYNMKLRPDDIWIVTFPKSGSHWIQEIVWLLANNCDYDGAKIDINDRVSFLDFGLLPNPVKAKLVQGFPPVPDDYREVIKTFYARPSPRVFLTHIPVHLLARNILETCKIIYLARNPKDVTVSFYYHQKKISGYDNDFETYVDYFMREEVMYSPFFAHVKEAWSLRNHPNMNFMFYEEMKQDLPRELKRLASFLGKEYNDSDIEKMAMYMDFENRATAVHNKIFLRKGQVGDWKNHFSPELQTRMDEWIERNLAGTQLSFIYELQKEKK